MKLVTKNWNLYSLSNSWLQLAIAPEIGARILQMEMDGFPYFFVHPKLYDTVVPATRLGTENSWLNYGGEKIWVAPQGWTNDMQWPGPPDPVLDGGEYTIIAYDDSRIELISQVDPNTGLQIHKIVSLCPISTKVKVASTFINHSNKSKEWSIWPVLQLNTDEEDEERYRIYCPICLDSKFQDGYKILHGLVNNPQVQVNERGQFELKYKYIVGKHGFDTEAGWAAYVDVYTGKTLVLFFKSDLSLKYPENTNIQFYTAGEGLIYSRSVIRRHLNDRELNPAYLEMEILSPLESMNPGDTMSFNYEIASCTLATFEGVFDVNENVVTALPLQIKEEEDGVFIVGKWGVFQSGYFELQYWDDLGDSKVIWKESVNPLYGISLHLELKTEYKPLLSRFNLSFFDVEGNCISTIMEKKYLE